MHNPTTIPRIPTPRRRFNALWLGPLLLSCGGAQAGYFGGVESGMAEFENFSAAAGADSAVAGSALYGVINLGAFRVLGNERTAALGKLHVQQLRFDEQKELDNNTAAGEFGIYHQFNAKNSVVALAGARTLSYDDSRRDDTIVGGKLSYTLQFTQHFKFTTELHYDQGTKETLSGQLTGYGAASTLGWSPHRIFSVTLGAARGVNSFEQTVLDASKASGKSTHRSDETSDSGWVSLNLAITQRLYLTGSMTTRRTSYDEVEDSSGKTYSLGLGFKFF